MQKLLALFVFALLSLPVFSQTGYKIRVKVNGYKNDTLVLGYNYGDKQYIKDTTFREKDGFFTFEGKESLECGVYLLVLRPENKFIQILVSDGDQNFTLHTDADHPVEEMKVKGSPDNEIFNEYLNWLSKQRLLSDTMSAQMKRAPKVDSIQFAAKLVKLDDEVKAYQTKIIEKHPNTMTARIIKSAMDVKIPEFEGGTDQEKQMKRYRWYKAHYFDNVDISDPCMLRSPVLHQRMVYYVDKLTPQHPDSISQAVDYLLKKTGKAEETYKFYLIHFLNHYAKSNIVGMDAVYVHLADNYYCNGGAKWAKKEDLDKICDNANRLRPILIGKIAPNILCEKKDGSKMNLYDVDADYTVLWFWAWDCGHCKKTSPDMVKFIKKWKDKNVKVFAVCTAMSDKVGECWKAVDEREFSDFINLVDPYLRSNYKTLYDVRSTPQLFILDRKHEILMKRVGPEELDKVMEQVIEMEEMKKKDGIK